MTPEPTFATKPITYAKAVCRRKSADGRHEKSAREFGELRRVGIRQGGVAYPWHASLTVGNYLLDYEISGDAILVVAIRHGRQLSPDMPRDDDFDFERCH